MRNIILLITAFILWGCTKGIDNDLKVSQEQSYSLLSFQTILQDPLIFNNQSPILITLKSKKEELDFLRANPPTSTFPEVDYEKYIVVGILLGWRPSISIQILIDSLKLVDYKIKVYSHEYEPAGQRMQEGNPAHLIVIEKNTSPIVFEPIKYVHQQGPEYVSGQVVIKTTADISLIHFLSFIDSLGISILSRDYDRVYFWIEVPPDSFTYYIILFSKEYSLFTGVTELNYPYSDGEPGKKYIFASYKSGKDASDITEGKLFIENLKLMLKRVSILPMEPEIFAVLNVPEGKEIYWVTKLMTYHFIKFAELNYIAKIWN